MGDPRHESGLAAEQAVADWLAAHRWRVLARRYRSAQGEIDLVALDPDGWLVGVEVRLRRSGRTGAAAASVSARHVRRVEASLAGFARGTQLDHAGLRVDLVTVEPGKEPQTWRLTRIPAVDAW